MERIYNTYLKIIKNICTSSDHSVSVYPEDLPALAKLAQEPLYCPICTAISPVCFCLSCHEAAGKRHDAELLSD